MMQRTAPVAAAVLLSAATLFTTPLPNVSCFQIRPSLAVPRNNIGSVVSSSRVSRSNNKNKHSLVLKSTVEDVTEEAVSLSGPPAITARDLTCTFDGGDNYQLQSANYILPRGGRVGLVGRNGCGKSTFLRILAEACEGVVNSKRRENEIVAYTGEVECPRDVSVAFVEQEPPSPSDVTVSDALLGVTQNNQSNGGGAANNSGNAVYEIVRRYRRATLNAATDPDAFSNAASAMDANNGWAVMTKAEEVSTRLRVR